MKNDIILFLDVAVTDKALQFEDLYLPEYLLENLQTIPEINAIYYSIPETYTGKLLENEKSFQRHTRDDAPFWKELFSILKSDTIIKIFLDSPFIDKTIIQEMLTLHLDSLAEFTFSENLPSGFTAEIISKELIERLPDFEEKTLSLNEVIKSNINQFDVEIYYKDPDIRDKRLDFRAHSIRNRQIMSSIYSLNKKIPEYHLLKKIIEKNPEVLYIGPSYIEIELTGKCELDCIFCYRKSLEHVHPSMETEVFQEILTQMNDFALPYSISLGGSGEPMMHIDFHTMLQMANQDPLIENIVVETNGINVDEKYIDFLKNNGKKIKTIININGIDSESYALLHGANYFDTVYNNILSLKKSLSEDDTLFIQVMKINETKSLPGKSNPEREYLDAYYDFWEKIGVPIILQKQNTFLGRIEDRRYSDLSPLKRIPCWHLQRDIYILSDGTVAFCKQDVDGLYSENKITKQSLREIWISRQEEFLQNYKAHYPSAPDCQSCDEWYTFNL